jgi:replicative DNA helicase
MMDRHTDPLAGLSQRLRPSNPQAEQALLGALLANNKVMDLCEGLEPEHFNDPIHGRIFAEIRTLVGAGRLADAVTLKATFENAGVLDEVGGTAYLAKLLTAMVGILNAGEYARTIRDAWVRRALIDLGEDAVNLAFGADPAVDGEAAVNATMDGLLALGETAAAGDSGDFAGAVDAAASDAADAMVGKAPRLMTGITSLDDMWGGLYPASLDILAARSMHGKTALGMQIAENVARALRAEAQGGPSGTVQIFSLEMERKALALRMLASATGISSDAIRSGSLTIGDAGLLVQAQKDLRGLPLIVQDKPGMTLGEIRIAARVAVRRRRVRLIVIDHLHRIKPDKTMRRMDRLERVQHIAETVKDMAKSLNVPVLLLAQISRQAERREGPDSARPRVSDLMYGGEQDADNIMLLWRPELYMSDAPPNPPDRLSEEKKAAFTADWHAKRNKARGMAEVIAGKRRYGRTGSVWLRFDGPRTRFEMPQDDTIKDLWSNACE